MEIFAKTPFLFSGYSFRDWNIKSIYLKIYEKRPKVREKEVRDFAVLKQISVYDWRFFEKHNIEAVEIDLNDFIKGLKSYA